MNVDRGDMYFIAASGNPTIGSEQRAGRPGIIVSNNMGNYNSNTVEVVYLTTREKNPLPTHVKVDCRGTESTALCEQICSVSKDRILDYCGTLTQDELQELEEAMLVSLGITRKVVASTSNDVSQAPSYMNMEAIAKKNDQILNLQTQLTAATLKYNLISELHNELLNKLTKNYRGEINERP